MLSAIAESILNENLFGSGGKSLGVKQSGKVTMTAGTVNIPIDPVNLDKAVVIVYCKPASYSATAANTAVKGKLTSTTNLELNLFTYNASYQPEVFWQVVEFENLKSLQKGSLRNNGSNPLSITGVDLNKSIIISSNNAEGTQTQNYYTVGYCEITDATTLTFNNAGWMNYEWQLAEFK